MFESMKVLEVGGGLAGALCCSHFVQFGATVYKVENPGGDWTRSVPPTQSSKSSALFASLNRGKRSIALDLEDQDRLADLSGFAGKMDVLVYDRTMLSPEQGKALRTRLTAAKDTKAVMCCISAFGDKGAWSSRSGSEFTAQAASGYWRYLAGPWEQPLRVGAYIATVGTAVFAAQGIMAAFLKRARQSSGGDIVEVNLLQSLLAMKTHHIAAQYGPDRWEGTRATGATDEPQYGWKAGDGKHLVFSFAFGTGKAEGWRDFCHAVGIADRVIDEQLSDGALQTTGIGSAANRCRAIYESYFNNYTAEEVVRLVRKHDGTGSLYDGYDQLIASHVKSRHVFGTAQGAGKEHITVGIPWLFNDKPIRGENSIPEIGQNNAELFTGFSG